MIVKHMTPEEREMKVLEVTLAAKQWAKDGTHVLQADLLVVGKVAAAYTGEEGDRYKPKDSDNELQCAVVVLEEGHALGITERTAYDFVPLSRELLGFYQSMLEGIRGLVMVGAKSLAKGKQDPETGIKLLEAALRTQVRALKAGA